MERVLWPVYQLVLEVSLCFMADIHGYPNSSLRLQRSRRDLVRSSIVNKLKDLGDLANGAYKTAGKQTVQGRRLRNIRDVTDVSFTIWRRGLRRGPLLHRRQLGQES